MDPIKRARDEIRSHHETTRSRITASNQPEHIKEWLLEKAEHGWVSMDAAFAYMENPIPPKRARRANTTRETQDEALRKRGL
jgi:hypothetical protein